MDILHRILFVVGLLAFLGDFVWAEFSISWPAGIFAGSMSLMVLAVLWHIYANSKD